MDPHSRLSQFNQRIPKTGPLLPTSRFMEPIPRASLGKSPQNSPKSPSSPAHWPTSRPIATNSRVKQDEKYKKDMYLAFADNALQQKLNGSTESFDALINQFDPKKVTSDGILQTAQLRLWISALSHVVSRLERTHSGLVEAIVDFPWTTTDSAFVKSYVHFIGMLLSARPEYLSLVLGKITQGFTYQTVSQALCSSAPEGSSSPLTRRVVYDRLHILLRHIYSLIPTLPFTLRPLLVRKFPHKRQDQVTQTTYIRNLLRVTEYCPELADKILALIIDHTVQIDVEIQVELEELEEEGPHDEELFDLDPFDTVIGQDGDCDSSDESDDDDNLSDLSSEGEDMDDAEPLLEIPTNVQHIRDMVKKLDAILKLIFDYLKCRHPPAALDLSPLSPSPPPSESLVTLTDSVGDCPPSSVDYTKAERHSQFHTLLSIFDRTILRTFKSRYTQFLLFWYCSLDAEFSDLFLGMLVSKALLEQDQPAVTRAAAASYIASFVSRAQFIDRDGARRVTSVLCSCLRKELDIFDIKSQSGTVLPGIGHHNVFFAISQAVFLIFCFRWRDLLEEAEEDVDELLGRPKASRKWMRELHVVQRLITSPLNPLKVCSANVVMQFARVAQSTGFIYCYSILESNKRMEYASGSVSRDQRLGVHPSTPGTPLNAELNTFFPFDPYMLPKSNSYIQGVYREWSSVAIDDDVDEDVEEEGEGDDDHDETRHQHCLDIQRPVVNSKGLTASLDAMSISQ